MSAFFEELIGLIIDFGGDVIKFAGDAILCTWSSRVSGESLQLCTQRAAACAVEQLSGAKKLHMWDTGEGVKLALHIGMGAGRVIGLDLGNPYRREYVVAGDPLRQLSEAEGRASAGECVVSPECWELIKGSGASGSVYTKEPKSEEK